VEIKELNKLLCQNVLSVCKLLLPDGQITGDEYCVGSLNGEKGSSLRVHIGKGEKLGLWTDFSTGDKGGDLVDLWMKVNQITKKEAVKEIKLYLNLQDTTTPVKEHPKPKPRENPVKDLSPVMRYLTEERKITPETIRRYRIGESLRKPNKERVLKDWIVFPFYKNSEVIKYKLLAIERNNGDKDLFSDPKGALHCLFGWQALTGNERSITIDEGEINAMSLYQYGHPTLSVPIGAGNGNKQQWVENEFDDLELFDTIYLRADDDEAGELMIKELVPRLGRHRCRILKFPFDPNECLQRGFTKAQVDKIYAEAEYIHPPDVKNPIECLDKVIKIYYRDPHEPYGFTPRFKYLQPEGYLKYPKFEFRYKENTVLAGYNHEGKSQMVKQFLLDAIQQGERCCYADLENPMEVTTHRFSRTSLTEPFPSHALITSCVQWLREKLWIIERTEGMSLDRLHESFVYLRKKFGVKIFVIDSLTKIDGVEEEDLESQKRVINRMQDFDRTYETHTILVAHFKKPAYSNYVDIHHAQNRFQISGSGKISDLTDNALLMFRNRFKEEVLSGRVSLPEGRTLDSLTSEPDALLIVDKQRNGESWVGHIRLWWNQQAMQYLEGRTDEPFKYFK